MSLVKRTCCPFCKGLLAGRSEATWDTILKDTGDYIITPTKGSLVPGWLLVVAKRHALCSGALADADLRELKRTLALASELVRDNFGPPTLFEHGPSREGTSLGCGVDHVHIHVAPLQFSLVEAVSALLPQTQWEGLSDLSETRGLYEAAIGYALVQENDRLPVWCRPPNGMRQMFRQAIARALGTPTQFDYVLCPHAENALRTLKYLSHLTS